MRENAKRLNNWMIPPHFPWSRIPTYEQNLLLSFKVSWMPGLTYPYAVSHWLVVRCSMYLPVFQPISNHATPFTFTRRFCPSKLWVIWSQNIFHPFLFSTPWNVFVIFQPFLFNIPFQDFDQSPVYSSIVNFTFDIYVVLIYVFDIFPSYLSFSTFPCQSVLVWRVLKKYRKHYICDWFCFFVSLI